MVPEAHRPQGDPLTLAAFEGRSFGPARFRVCAEKVHEFVVATSDEPARWQEVAPPGFAAALLFVVAPKLLEDPALEGAVVHGDQGFTWHAPLEVEADLIVTGTVGRVRHRGDSGFVSFQLTATANGQAVVEGTSTFLIGKVSDDAIAERPEVGVDVQGAFDPPNAGPPARRSVSRAGLVRYAAATRDWNPIHWDHDAGVAAGLGGIVVHGLLQSAWLCQVASAARSEVLASARFRYRAPLHPGVTATISGSLDGEQPSLALSAEGITFVTGRFGYRGEFPPAP